MPGPPASVGDYLRVLSDESRAFGETLRRTIRAALPQAVETIRYGMPAYCIGDATIIYFAVWKKHAALYPIYRGEEAFEHEIAPFRAKKDTVRFPLDGAPPTDLVRRIVESQLAGITSVEVRARS